MYLKNVEIYGFKSFGEKVKIDFGNGLTSIVGPNGSGKSNILDGILWVLGEQSYKNIRAKESKDVIFAGGEGKKSSSYAEVSLLMDNTDRFFPVESDEIKITRKLSQDGTNDYFLNDKKARLKDIGDIFLDTGIGKSAYSVIGQGKVERIISASSKEIKNIIEEAAGVKKFQIKKIESERKLENVQNEFEKIDIVIRELEENRNKIEKQSKKAIEYLDLEKNKKTLLKSVLIYDAKAKEEIIKTGTSEQERLKLVVEFLETEMERIETEIKENEEKKSKLLLDIEMYSENNDTLKTETNNLEKEKIKIEEELKFFSIETVRLKDEIKNIEIEILSKEENIKNLEIEKEKILKIISEFEAKNNEYEKHINEKDNEKIKLEKEKNLKLQEIMDFEVEKSKLITDIESSERVIKSSNSKILTLTSEEKAIADQLEDSDKNLSLFAEKKDKKNKEIEEIQEKQIDLENEITTLSQNINKAFSLINKSENEKTSLVSRLQGLYRVQESNDGFYKSVKEVLNAKIEGVNGVLISLLNVPEIYQKAIEAAIPGNLQDIVVENSNVAKKAIEMLKERRVGRASFLAIDTIKVSPKKTLINLDGVIGRASELVSIDKKFQNIIDMLLGNVLVVNDTDVALKILKNNTHSGNIVTISGELLNSRGRITGGENSNSLMQQISERKKEISKLEFELEEKTKLLDEWKRKNDVMNEKLEKYEEEISDIDLMEENLRKEGRILEEEYEDLKSKISKLAKSKEVVSIELEAEKKYIQEYEKKQEIFRNKKDVNEKIIVELREKVKIENEELELKTKEIEKLKGDFSDTRILYLNSEDREKKIIQEIDNENLEHKTRLLKKEEKNLKISEIEEKFNSSKDTEKFILEEMELKKKQFDSEHAELSEMRRNEQELNSSLKELIRESGDVKTKLFKEKEIMNKEMDRKDRIVKELDEVKNQINEFNDIEFLELDETKINETRIKIKNLEYEIREFGAVNLLAIEEFKEIDAKYNHLLLEKEDLQNSKKSLTSLIAEIEKAIKEKFYIAYNEIDKNFNEMCVETLDNSEGKLILVEDDNFENCGIEISVKFKNKRRQSLSLLSGGEKSMVAIAFIIAIFMYKPSPFTFLDEIEAALDEKNTKKLITKLKSFTDRSQFILITHNKETMRSADTLYGVTMNKKIGISKLVQVKF